MSRIDDYNTKRTSSWKLIPAQCPFYKENYKKKLENFLACEGVVGHTQYSEFATEYGAQQFYKNFCADETLHKKCLQYQALIRIYDRTVDGIRDDNTYYQKILFNEGRITLDE